MTPALIPITPDPIALPLGPINIGWYGIGYVVGAGRHALRHRQREAGAPRLRPEPHLERAAARSAPWPSSAAGSTTSSTSGGSTARTCCAIVLPPYAGLGLYGGVLGAAIGILIYTRWKKSPLRAGARRRHRRHALRAGHRALGQLLQPGAVRPADRSAVGHRHRLRSPRRAVPVLASTRSRRPASIRSSSTNRRSTSWAASSSCSSRAATCTDFSPVDLAAFWGIWYGATRGLLESFRAGWNWTLGGIATAQLIGIALVIVGIVWIAYNHRPRHQALPVSGADQAATAAARPVRRRRRRGLRGRLRR